MLGMWWIKLRGSAGQPAIILDLWVAGMDRESELDSECNIWGWGCERDEWSD